MDAQEQANEPHAEEGQAEAGAPCDEQQQPAEAGECTDLDSLVEHVVDSVLSGAEVVAEHDGDAASDQPADVTPHVAEEEDQNEAGEGGGQPPASADISVNGDHLQGASETDEEDAHSGDGVVEVAAAAPAADDTEDESEDTEEEPEHPKLLPKATRGKNRKKVAASTNGETSKPQGKKRKTVSIVLPAEIIGKRKRTGTRADVSPKKARTEGTDVSSGRHSPRLLALAPAGRVSTRKRPASKSPVRPKRKATVAAQKKTATHSAKKSATKKGSTTKRKSATTPAAKRIKMTATAKKAPAKRATAGRKASTTVSKKATPTKKAAAGSKKTKKATATKKKAAPMTKKGIEASAKKSAAAPRKKVAKLSARDAHIKYRARLSTLPESEFKVLDGKWISVYDGNLSKRVNPKEGVFPLKWMQVLNDVAIQKGAHIKGVLPHYADKDDDHPELKAYRVKPDSVDWDKVDAYHKAGYTGVSGDRIYVGKAVAAAGTKESQFAFKSSDARADAFWVEVKKIIDGDEEEEEVDQDDDKEQGSSGDDQGSSDEEETSE